MPEFMMKQPGAVSFHLEAGKVYPITLTISGHIPEAYDYQIGKKDLQVRLAWVTPSQKERNYTEALEAAGQSGKSVVLFAHEIDSLYLEERLETMLTEAIRSAKQAGNKVVLVLSTALPVDISAWEADCDAILAAWLPGQTGGQAIANVLTGACNPSGKLSVTWPRNFEADQRELNPNGRKILLRASHPASNVPTEIREGLFNGYKWYDATGRTDQVLYPFGHGLSYADFTQTVTEVSPAADPGENAGLDVARKWCNSTSKPRKREWFPVRSTIPWRWQLPSVMWMKPARSQRTCVRRHTSRPLTAYSSRPGSSAALQRPASCNLAKKQT